MRASKTGGLRYGHVVGISLLGYIEPGCCLEALKNVFFKGAIPDGTLSSRRVVPHPSSPIYLNVTIWVQNRRFELKLGPNRSVSVQIAILTVQNKRKPLKHIEPRKNLFLNCPQVLLKITWLWQRDPIPHEYC